jgi:hypothetical protein
MVEDANKFRWRVKRFRALGNNRRMPGLDVASDIL